MKNVGNRRVGFFDVRLIANDSAKGQDKRNTATTISSEKRPKNFLSSPRTAITCIRRSLLSSRVVFRCECNSAGCEKIHPIRRMSAQHQRSPPLPNCCLRVCLVEDYSGASVSRDGVLSCIWCQLSVCWESVFSKPTRKFGVGSESVRERSPRMYYEIFNITYGYVYKIPRIFENESYSLEWC